MQIRLPVFVIVILLLAALLPVSITSFALYKQVYSAVETSTKEKLAMQSEHTRDYIKQEFSLAISALTLLTHQAAITELEQGLTESALQLLGDFSSRYQEIESLYILSSEGKVLTGLGGNETQVERERFLSKLRGGSQSTGLSHFIFFKNDKLLSGLESPYGVAILIPLHKGAGRAKTYLLALVPAQKLTQRVKQLNRSYNVALYTDNTWLAGDYWTDNENFTQYTLTLSISDPQFTNGLNLELVVGEPLTELSAEVERVLQPLYSIGAIILLLIFLLTLVIAHQVSRTLGRLYTLIQGFQRDASTPDSHSFAIKEFDEVYRLCSSMQSTIGEQLKSLKEKNEELSKVDQLREKYLNRVEELSLDLETKVNARTGELEQSIAVIENSKLIFEQVVRFRRQLQLCEDNQDVARLTLEKLQTSIANINVVLSLPNGRDNGEILLATSQDKSALNSWQDKVAELGSESWQQGIASLEGGRPVFKLDAGKDEFGWLVLSRFSDAEAMQWALLFAKELSSYMEIRALTQELDFLAKTDSLTGLGNRKAFDESLETLETQLDAEVGLYIIDVNGLKEINDNKGHDAGDQLLVKVAKMLLSCTSGISRGCYRLGGDEYAVILVDEEMQRAQELYQRLLDAQPKMDFAFDVLGGYNSFSCSIGYASTENTAFSLLYRAADQNMYQVKREHYRQVRERKNWSDSEQ